MFYISLNLIFVIMLFAWSMGALYFKKEDMSWLKAYKTALEKAVNWFGTPNQPTAIEYPVYIGIDQFGSIYANVIDNEFFPVLRNFVSSYFQDYMEYPNHLEYYFFASNFKLDITDDWEKIMYLRDIAEKVVHQYIQKNYPSFGAIPNNLVALNLISDTFFVSIAKNTAGIAENKMYMDNLRKKMKQNALSKNPANVDEELEKELKEMENNA